MDIDYSKWSLPPGQLEVIIKDGMLRAVRCINGVPVDEEFKDCKRIYFDLCGNPTPIAPDAIDPPAHRIDGV